MSDLDPRPDILAGGWLCRSRYGLDRSSHGSIVEYKDKHAYFIS